RQENQDLGKLEKLHKKIGILISSMYKYTDDISTTKTTNKFPIYYWRAKQYKEKTSKLLLDHPCFYDSYFGWENYSTKNYYDYKGSIIFHDPIPGNHYTIMKEENSIFLANEFKKYLITAEKISLKNDHHDYNELSNNRKNPFFSYIE